MKILLIGDIVGEGGRAAVRELVPRLRGEYGCDFCVANGENMAGGNGFTKKCLAELADAQLDVFTSGDHTWDQKEWEKDIELFPNVLRPANSSRHQPGRGYGLFSAADGSRVGVVNLIGRTFMGMPSNCPFDAVEEIVEELRRETPYIVVDFHAEATSDKIAMGRFLDGRVSVVVGTHTHVPTADEQIFEGGTAFQSDLGMVGSRKSILGREIASILGRYRRCMPARFPVVNTEIRMNATVVTLDEDGHAVHIERVVRDYS